MEALTANGSLTVEQLPEHFDVTNPQLNTWLKRGVEEKKLRKLRKPTRYGWQQPAAIQSCMFDEGP